MMRTFIAVLLALLSVSPAAAISKYVSPTGSATWANATSPATPASMATANANAVPGDNVHMAAGTYGTGIAPANSGTAGNRIVFMGAAGDSSSVIVPSINLNRRDYVTVKWMRVTGDANVGQNSGVADAPVSDSIYFCRILGAFGFTGSYDLVVANCVVGIANTPAVGELAAAKSWVGHEPWTYRATFNDCEFYVSGGTNSLNNGNNSFKLAGVVGLSFNRTLVQIFSNASSSDPVLGMSASTEWTQVKDCTFTDFTMEMVNKSVVANAWLLFMRDSCRTNTFTRCTIRQHPSSTNTCRISFSNSGTYTGERSQYANKFYDCRFSTGGNLENQHWATGYVWDGCTFWWGGSGGPWVNNSPCDSITIRHCTFVGTGTSQIFNQLDAGTWARVRMDHNIFVRVGNGTLPLIETAWTATMGPGVNNNLFYCTGDPSDSLLALKVGTVTDRVGPSSAHCANGHNCSGRWGNPGFADIANGDFTPSPSGSAVGAYWPDGYVGAIGTAAADTVRPAPITTLATSSPTPSTITLSWTAVGDDSLTGTATSYQVRRNIGAAISSEGLWDASTVVYGAPTPQAAGSAESMVVTGLASSTNYYFAVRAIDNLGQRGALSNSPLGTTAPDVTRPAPITNLSVQSTTGNSAQLTWTAVGDDSLTGQAVSVEIRRSLAPITNQTEWNAATVGVTGLGANPPGTAETVQISGLASGTTYYFAARTVDEVPNQSAISPNAIGTTLDVVAPQTISDLEVKNPTGTTITLSWTAPGDDGATGTATSYQVRYRLGLAIVTPGDFAAATPATGVPTPSVAGSAEQLVVSGLTSDRLYYFAVRAVDEAGNTSGVSNSPFANTLDITAPSAITDLSLPSVTATSITLRWTSPGDDGATGAAAYYVGRYSTAGPVTNETLWDAATPIVGLPTPAAAGAIQSFTVEGLASGTTYYFGLRAVDEAANMGAIGTSPGRATLVVDGIRPAAPVIEAKQYQGKPDAAAIIFSAVGDDSLTGTATSYVLRYRLDGPPTTALWDAASNLSRTYRVTVTNVPRAAGQAETLVVRGLRPNRPVWFALRAVDDVGLASAVSAADSMTPPDVSSSDMLAPVWYLYGGAGPGSRPAWFPFVSLDGSAVDTAQCRAGSRRSAISLCPEFADSAGPYGKLVALAAIKTMKAMNPRLYVLGEPVVGATYFQSSAESLWTYGYRHDSWSTIRAIAGWTPGTGAPGGAWNPATYTDSTGGNQYLWTNVAGYRGWFYQTFNNGKTRGVSYAGVAGLTTWNVNIAYPFVPSNPFVVMDAIVDLIVQHYVARRHPDGSFVWDGVRFDLFVQRGKDTQLQYENIDFLRAGFPTQAAFDSAWTAASVYGSARLRRLAIDAGRPEFVISGNGGSQVAFDSQNGWMREGFPSQQGGSRWTNLWYYPGGGVMDEERSAYRPRDNVVFPFICSGDSCLAGFDPYSSTVRQQVRDAAGCALMFNGGVTPGPEPASIPRGGGYHQWTYDEAAVDTVTAQAYSDAWHMGWLGRPLDRLYYNLLPIGSGVGLGGDLLWNAGLFENGDIADWSRTNNAQVLIDAVTDTVRSGTTAMRVRVASPQTIDYAAAAQSNIRFYGTTGDSFVVTFYARADGVRPVQVGLRGMTSGALRSSWSTNCRQWLFPGGWRPYVLVGALETPAAGAESLQVVFWAGDTTGTFWLDDVRVYKGRPRGGSMARHYGRGVVVYNPFSRPDTITLGRAVRRIRSIAGRTVDVNTGELLAAGTPIVVPGLDSRFLLWPVDSLRPSRVTNLLADTPTSGSARVSWTAPGDDSLSGTAALFELRRSASAIVTEGDWAAATPVPGMVAVAAGTPVSVTVTGLSASSAYYFAFRATDEAGYPGAISNSDSVTTLPEGSPPNAAFSLTPTSGAEPLTIAITDLTTGGPTTWEWYVRTEVGENDPQISGEQNPTFTLNRGAKYLLSLQAYNAFGSDTTLTTVTVTCTPPAPIYTLTASPTAPTVISLTYKESGDDGDAGTATEFLLRYREGATFTEGDWATATPATGLPIPAGAGTVQGVVVSGLEPGHTYAFAMKARDDGACESTLGTVAVASTPSADGAFGNRAGVQIGQFRVRVKQGGSP